MTARQAPDDPRSVPGIGASLFRDLGDLGHRGVSDFAGADPEAVSARRCRFRGGPIDGRLLDAFRSAADCATCDAPLPTP